MLISGGGSFTCTWKGLWNFHLCKQNSFLWPGSSGVALNLHGLVKHRTQQGANILKNDIKIWGWWRSLKGWQQGGQSEKFDCSQITELLNRWTGSIQTFYSPSKTRSTRHMHRQFYTQKCAQLPWCSQFRQPGDKSVVLAERKVPFFFLLLSWQPGCLQQGWSGGRKLFCICMTASTVCYRLGRHCPAPPIIYLSNSGRGLEWSHPEPFAPKYPGACLQHCSLDLKTVLQQHKVHEMEQVQQWEPGLPGRGRQWTLKLKITSWGRIFRNGLALSLYFSILTISVAISQLCLLPASTGCSFPFKDLYQS